MPPFPTLLPKERFSLGASLALTSSCVALLSRHIQSYKMYLPPLSDESREIASWDYRRNLLRQRIAAVDADVVCLQEVSPLSFDDDFAFMAELGYDGHEMFNVSKGYRCWAATIAG